MPGRARNRTRSRGSRADPRPDLGGAGERASRPNLAGTHAVFLPCAPKPPGVLGIMPVSIRDTAQRLLRHPLRAGRRGRERRSVLALHGAAPHATPRLVQSMRLPVAPAWLLPIAAEASAPEAGLDHRIFLVTRSLATDVFLTYAARISPPAVVFD